MTSISIVFLSRMLNPLFSSLLPGAVGRMVHAVVGFHGSEVKWIHALETSDVVAVFLRIRAPLVMRVDAAVRAEVVARHFRIELVQLEDILTLDDSQACQRHRGNDRALPATDGTVTAPRTDYSIWQGQLQLHRAAVAGGPVTFMDHRGSYLLDHDAPPRFSKRATNPSSGSTTSPTYW